MNFIIRPAIASDASALAALERECFSEPWSENALFAEIGKENAGFFVAQSEEGDVIGYAGMLFVLDEAQITNVAVTARARRCGVGKRLMEALEERARQCGMRQMQLEVRASGQAARGLYEKMQYVCVGVRKRFYRFPTEDAVLMNKDL